MDGFCSVETSLPEEYQINVYPGVPPVTSMEMLPFCDVLVVDGVIDIIFKVMVSGWVMVIVVVAVQPILSVTVTEYPPGARPDIV